MKIPDYLFSLIFIALGAYAFILVPFSTPPELSSLVLYLLTFIIFGYPLSMIFMGRDWYKDAEMLDQADGPYRDGQPYEYYRRLGFFLVFCLFWIYACRHVI